MKLSAQEEYGLRLLVQIARKPNGQSSSIPELARLEDLTEPHVAKLLMILRKAGYIDSIRGQLGGYVLAKQPETVTLKDVLNVLGGRLFEDGFCDRHSGLMAKCRHAGDCHLHDLWNRIQEAIDGVTGSMTLADIILKPSELIQLQANQSGRTKAAGGGD